MSETTYHLENAASGRAKCKKCKETIAKGELRISTHAYKEGQDFTFTTYTKPKCFQIPPRALKGVTPQDFVDNILVDDTADGILADPARREEIVADIAYKPPRKSAGAKGGDGGEGSAVDKRLAEVKKAMEQLPGDEDSEEEAPPTKRAKSAGSTLERYARAMQIYGKMTVDELKAVLQWNHGYGTSGNKSLLLLRCIDGHVNGRLARCPTCFLGKLNVNESDAGRTVLCKGYFDEDIQSRMPCSYTVSATDVPRLTPWYAEEPSEEQVAAMKAVTKQHEALLDGGGSDAVPSDLAAAAAALEPRWDPSQRKECAQAMVDLCGTRVDLPQDDKKARMAVGKLLLSRPAATCAEMLAMVVQEFGVASAKEGVKAKQKDALADSCAVAANAGIVMAFKELGDLYFKDGNTNAGLVYKKAIASLTALDYEITAENAKGLGKGKTKVAGIGKGTADKIHEYYDTGTIQKLEEKRLIHS